MENDPYSVILVSLILSAFFSGIEIAFISSNKLKFEVEKNKGGYSAKFFSKLIKTPAKFITAMLLGNNISLVIYGLAMADILTPVITNLNTNPIFVLLIQTLISTTIILVIAEFMPKVIFSKNPNKTLSLFTIPVLIMYYLLYPFVIVVNALSNFIFKYIFRIEINDQKLSYGLVDLDHYLKDITSGKLEDEELDNEIQILQNVLEFTSVKTRECMIPRNEIVAVEMHDKVKDVINKLVESGHSKLPVYRGTIDHITGYIHSSDLFNQPKVIKHILRPISVVPETMAADEVMSNFIKKRKSMAVVVDEFGGTSGILTLEDVVEEIFGEIEDEHDKDELIENKISDTEYIFSSRLEIDYLNEEYDLNFVKSDNYETLAGFIIDHFESIPEKGTLIEIGKFNFEILSESNNKINLIKLILKSDN